MTGRVVPVAGRLHTGTRAGAGEAQRRRSVRAAVVLLVPVMTLLVVGLGAILSSSSVVGLRESGDHLFYFKRQLVWAGVGVVAMVVTLRIPYDWYRRLAAPMLVASIVSLVAVLAIGSVRGGARRWIEVGPITVQPAEFAKFAVIAYLAMVLARRAGKIDRLVDMLAPLAASAGVVAGLVVLEPDLGTALLIGAAAFGVLMASTTPLRYIFATASAAGMAGLFLAASEPYRFARLKAFLDPGADVLGSGFQAMQSLVALGTGGWFGVGLGASRARWSFLPNAHTDFIFAIVGEEMGFAGAIVVVALFAAFALGGTAVALRAPDAFGRLLGIGIVTWLSAQALVNIGGVVSLLPITGVPLPFMSTGGTALVVNLAAAGVLGNIAQAGSSR